MPSPESPANRTTAPRMTSRLGVSWGGDEGLGTLVEFMVVRNSVIFGPQRTMSNFCLGCRGVSFEQASEPRTRRLDLLFRARSKFLVGGFHDLAFRFLRLPVRHGEQRVGDARRILSDAAP